MDATFNSLGAALVPATELERHHPPDLFFPPVFVRVSLWGLLPPAFAWGASWKDDRQFLQKGHNGQDANDLWCMTSTGGASIAVEEASTGFHGLWKRSLGWGTADEQGLVIFAGGGCAGISGRPSGLGT